MAQKTIIKKKIDKKAQKEAKAKKKTYMLALKSEYDGLSNNTQRVEFLKRELFKLIQKVG